MSYEDAGNTILQKMLKNGMAVGFIGFIKELVTKTLKLAQHHNSLGGEGLCSLPYPNPTSPLFSPVPKYFSMPERCKLTSAVAEICLKPNSSISNSSPCL